MGALLAWPHSVMAPRQSTPASGEIPWEKVVVSARPSASCCICVQFAGVLARLVRYTCWMEERAGDAVTEVDSVVPTDDPEESLRDDGDLELIRWALSLSVDERLAVLQDFVDTFWTPQHG